MVRVDAMKPLIGITVNAKEERGDKTGGKLWLNWNYAQVVADAGGIPILIPPQADMRELAQVIDGWLIPGGYDIDAKHFGEENHPQVELIEDERFSAEAELYKHLSAATPVLGICYGCQFINVQRGGKLIQHLPDIVGNEAHTGGTHQQYVIRSGSKLAGIVGDVAKGQSFHHQAVGALGEGLTVVAEHEDGMVEAIEATDRPWMVGVQWHPERTFSDPESRKLFEAFIRAAADYSKKKSAVIAR
jgi:putative glutamine amidotransferase